VSTPQVPTARISSHHSHPTRSYSPYELVLGCVLAVALTIVATLAALVPVAPDAGLDASTQAASAIQQARGKATHHHAPTHAQVVDAASSL
jgi:hypothetical protein